MPGGCFQVISLCLSNASYDAEAVILGEAFNSRNDFFTLLGSGSDNGFIFKKINENLDIKE